MKCFKHLLDEASSGKYFSLASYNYTMICKQRLMNQCQTLNRRIWLPTAFNQQSYIASMGVDWNPQWDNVKILCKLKNNCRMNKWTVLGHFVIIQTLTGPPNACVGAFRSSSVLHSAHKQQQFPNTLYHTIHTMRLVRQGTKLTTYKNDRTRPFV